MIVLIVLAVYLLICLGIARCFGIGRWFPPSVIVAILLSSAAVASAQERPSIFADPAAYVLVSGNVADLVTTGQAFGRGAHEGNGITSTNRIGPLAASKAAATVAELLALHLFAAHGHPRIGRVIGYGLGAVTWGAALHNRGVAR